MFVTRLSRASVRCISLPLRTSTAYPTTSVRYFHPSLVWSKGKKGSKKGSSAAAADSAKDAEAEAAEAPLEIDFDAITSKFSSVLENFNKQATEVKLGKTNPNIFDKLKVDVDGHTQPFTAVAQTTLKGGRNFLITVYDPAHTQAIVNAVLGSGLNMNPQRDPINKQTLKVPLPPPTVESRKEGAKVLKGVFDKLKNGASGLTLSSVRTTVKNDIQKHQKKKKKLTDAENKLVKDFDKLHKEYTDKLTEAFKSAEKALSK